ncbi:hypothetical protein K505DRAFT_341302 [Melanomma pulvis-pyrius CBS 109.77]|uniref:Uncharacterized protein n=1 Tax=Melanomma pulvis-pyrius CBS 109.77 TaxID=1314802 RepID=A0A6A6WZ83_9PLEO|nr:hypothetical protein K505DRAFT_341302 [Melanomma pulvis-pyrius CBS 109.77]
MAEVRGGRGEDKRSSKELGSLFFGEHSHDGEMFEVAQYSREEGQLERGFAAPFLTQYTPLSKTKAIEVSLPTCSPTAMCIFHTIIRGTPDSRAPGAYRVQRSRTHMDCESTACRTSRRYIPPTNPPPTNPPPTNSPPTNPPPTDPSVTDPSATDPSATDQSATSPSATDQSGTNPSANASS